MNRIEIGSYSAKSGWKQGQQSNNLPKQQIKQEKKKPRRFKKFFMGATLFVLLGLCAFLFYNFGNRVPGVDLSLIQPAQSMCTDLLDPKCWTNNFKPQLKQTNGYTNFLIIGLDTREEKGELLNTDTIALLSFNHETQETMLLSIPRDFYVPKYATRINAVYAYTKEKDKSDPFRYLREEVGAITGQEIHYFATVKFSTFTQIIDEVNGVEVCPEDAFTAQYPNDKPKKGEAQWLYYDFQKGCQVVNSDKALVYARFRYVSKGPSSLASDFSRARRQQEVIEAVKNKVLAQDMPISDRASKYWSLMQSTRQNIDTNVKFEDFLAGLSYINTASRQPLNIVLDPTFGGMNTLIYTDSSSGAYYIKPKDTSYKKIQSEITKIWENPELYKEQPVILVKNQGKTYLSTTHPARMLEKSLVFKESITYTNEFNKADFSGIKLVDFTNGEKSGTKQKIMTELNITSVTDPSEIGVIQSSRKEDFLILVGNSPILTPTTKP